MISKEILDKRQMHLDFIKAYLDEVDAMIVCMPKAGMTEKQRDLCQSAYIQLHNLKIDIEKL